MFFLGFEVCFEFDQMVVWWSKLPLPLTSPSLQDSGGLDGDGPLLRATAERLEQLSRSDEPPKAVEEPALWRYLKAWAWPQPLSLGHLGMKRQKPTGWQHVAVGQKEAPKWNPGRWKHGLKPAVP